tara:strand:- start:4259 stop:5107 length:849 start_codon:yes stop_codon:yes gene_type:complete
MKIIYTIEEMRKCSQELRDQGKTIANMDTSGYLHEGHISLIKIAKNNADIVILSIDHIYDYDVEKPEKFPEFLKKYRQDTFQLDVECCKLHGVDILWYFEDSGSWNLKDDPPLNQTLKDIMSSRCSTAENMLKMWPQQLLIEEPDITMAGQKDFYNGLIIRHIINELNLPIKVISGPIIRDSDGIALNSRNRLLTSGQRRRATSIYNTLKEISEWNSYSSVKEIKDHFYNAIKNARGYLDYIDVCDVKTGEKLDIVDREAAIVVGVSFGEIGLGDNIIIQPK